MAPSRTMTSDTFTDEKTPVSPTNTDTSTLQGDAIIEIREDNNQVDLEAAPVAAGEHAQPGRSPKRSVSDAGIGLLAHSHDANRLHSSMF